MPGGKRKGAGRPRGTGASPARITPAYKAVAAQRVDFVSLLPDWASGNNVHGGPYPNRLVDLHAVFADWIEAQEPGKGHGEACRQIVAPRGWIKAFKAAFPHVKIRANKARWLAFLNQQFTPSVPIPDQRYAVCECCRQVCRINGATNAPVPVEKLTALLEALDAEAKAEVGPEGARPTTLKRVYTDKT